MTLSQIILCPGQGAQFVGMGKAWFETSADAARTFGVADEILGDRFGQRLSELCFEGPEDVLNRTDVAQPAIFAASVACYQALFGSSESSQFVAMAGLSLGEYTALHLAGCFSFDEGLRLVALRGQAMQEAAEATSSGMVALIGADEESATTLCEMAAEGEILTPANFNAPGQVVISGTMAACDRAVEKASDLGLRATKLAVAGAFHSEIMRPAAARLAEALEDVAIREPACPVMSNVHATPHAGSEAENRPLDRSIRENLVEQLVQPVQWSNCCRWLTEHVSGEFHELAPGKVLSGLMRRISRETKVTNHDQP